MNKENGRGGMEGEGGRDGRGKIGARGGGTKGSWKDEGKFQTFDDSNISKERFD